MSGPWRPWPRGGRVAAALVALSPARAAAADAGSVTVECPELGSESSAALEARAKAELLVRQRDGAFAVVCRDGIADLSWRAGGDDGAHRSVPLLPTDPRASVEQVLEALDALLQQAPAARTGTPPAAPAPSPPASSPPAAGRASPTEPTGPGVAAGVAAEAWSPDVLGVVGPRARVFYRLPRGFVVDAGAEMAWTLRSSEAVSGRLIRFQVGSAYHWDGAGRWMAGISAFLDSVRATPSGSLHVARADRNVPGGALYMGYALWSGRPLSVIAGGDLCVHPGRVRVELGDHEVFGIPPVVVGAWLELALGPA